MNVVATLKEHAPMVRGAARKLSASLPASIDWQDLEQAGMIALWQATARFDEVREKEFGAFVMPRVRGAMRDELRNMDPLSRDDRAALSRIEAARVRLSHRLLREPRFSEVSHEVGMPLKELHERLGGVHAVDENPGPDPLDEVLEAEQAQWGVRTVDALPEKQRAIARGVLEGRTLRAAGKSIGVGESRACLLLSSAVERIQHANVG